MARQAANVRVRKGALVEAALPGRDRATDALSGRRMVPVQTRPSSERFQKGATASFVEPSGRLFSRKRPNVEFAIRDPPDQRRLRKDAAVQLRSLAFGVLIEHLAASRRSPPDDHAVRLGKNVRRQDFGLHAAAEGTHQRLDECHSERLRRTESGRRILVGGHVVPGDEAALAVAVDQQRLMQLEAMVLPDRHMHLHGVSPIPVM